jgi:hypothetical protein
MKLPKRRVDETAAATLDSILTAMTAVLLLASLGALILLLSSLHVGMRVGDILVFKPGTQVGDALAVSATYASPSNRGGTATCMLEPTVMVRDGGSLVVEHKSLTDPIYTVHWAGGRTADSVQDCGRSTDLVVTRMDLQSLVNAIGGFSFNSKGNVL